MMYKYNYKGWSSRILCEMEQKEIGVDTRTRGRPRAYDPDVALQRAMDAFWKSGYSGTSLDDIAHATGMNRPSLRAAFGDKRDLYLKALRAYWGFKLATMAKTLAGGTLGEALLRTYDAALTVYFSEEEGARGCFVVGTAITESVDDPEIREIVATGFGALDRLFVDRIAQARDAGELTGDVDPAALAILACGTMQTIALRARAGFARETLWGIAQKAVAVICR